MFPAKMKHHYSPSVADSTDSNGPICVHCGYAESAHTDKATCEACGTVCECGFFPDHKHPKKMLICYPCYDKEMKAAVAATNARVASYPSSPAKYFIDTETPTIKSIVDSVNQDPNVLDEDKVETICSTIKERILSYQKNIISLNESVRENQRLANEARVYLNHKMKEVSEEAQKRLGLTNINYKPEKPPSSTKTKSVSTKKVDMEQLKRAAAQYNIPIDALRIIVVARGVTIHDAVQIYLKLNEKKDGTND